MSNNRAEMPKNGPGSNEAPMKLTEERVLAIVEKFNDPRIDTKEHPEYFSIHLNNKVVRIPKWEYILYEKRQKISIEDEIKQTLNQEPL
ncbi:MAG: hypothetical protein AAB840_00915 [Patescibacteria group bacterium]